MDGRLDEVATLSRVGAEAGKQQGMGNPPSFFTSYWLFDCPVFYDNILYTDMDY